MKKTHDFDSVFDSQEVFRLILDATAHPLTPVNLKPYTKKIPFNEPQFLAIAMTLLDNEVSFNTCENGELSHNIRSLTLSSRKDIADADFVFVSNTSDLEDVIQNAKCGTDTNPHDTAAVIVKIDNEKEDVEAFQGPGIQNELFTQIHPMVNKAIALRDNMFFEFPKGIDLFFVDHDDNLFAVPRTLKKVV